MMEHTTSRSWPVYLVATFLGCAFFATLYPDPIGILTGTGGYFETGDVIQHVSGWLLYAKDQWRWPILTTKLLQAPEGVSIALTDSIPLAALAFKPIYPLLPENFHYFGIWHLLNKMGSAAGAVFLIRSLGRRDLFSGIVAACFALLWPAALARIDHTALSTHSLLLIALGTYFRALRGDWPLVRTSGAFGVLSLIALLVHPYLFAMVFPVFIAWSADRCFRSDGKLISSLAAVLSVVTAVAVVAIPLGYAGTGSVAWGYAHLSMNLLSPVCGGSLLPCMAWEATGGQYEGFNYFGIGGIAVVIVGAMLGARKIPAATANHPALLLVLVGLTLYALSNVVFIGRSVLFEYPLPPLYDRLTEIFRASGRFFWVPGYVIFFVMLAQILKCRRVATISFLLVSLVVQWADTQALRSYVAERTTLARPFIYDGWDAYAGRLKHIDVSPDYGCAENIETMRYLYFQMVAARLGASINTGYLARADAECREAAHEQTSEPDILRVFLHPVAGLPLPEDVEKGLALGKCIHWISWSGIALCTRDAEAMSWKALIGENLPAQKQ